MANFSNGAVNVTSTVTLALEGRGRRIGVIFQNKGSEDVYLGPDTSITTSNTISVPAGGFLNMSNKSGLFRGPIYGITATGTVDLRYWEWGE